MSRFVAIKAIDKAKLIQVRERGVGTCKRLRELAVDRVERRLRHLINEIRLVQCLNHENIAAYYDGMETSHGIYLIFEYVDGCDALQSMRKNLDAFVHQEAKVADIVIQVLQAIQYCHDVHQIYHRDLKLENIMLVQDTNQVKLIDFGLSTQTMTGKLHSLCGTPMYCSPELLWLTNASKHEGVWAQPVDVWSIGILTYVLVTGRAPFNDKDLDTLRNATLHAEIYYPEELSEELKSFLQIALHGDPHDRADVIELSHHAWLTIHTTTSVLPSINHRLKPKRHSSTHSITPTASLSTVESFDSCNDEDRENEMMEAGSWYVG